MRLGPTQCSTWTDPFLCDVGARIHKDFAATVPWLPLLGLSAMLKKNKKHVKPTNNNNNNNNKARNGIRRIKTAFSKIRIAFILRVSTLSRILQKKDEPSMELLKIPELV